MSRYIDADKLKEHYMWWGGGFTANCKDGQKEVKKIFDEIIDLQPTADVVKVIRCKDCIYWENGRCYLLRDATVEVRDNDYCSYGERADE